MEKDIPINPDVVKVPVNMVVRMPAIKGLNKSDFFVAAHTIAQIEAMEKQGYARGNTIMLKDGEVFTVIEKRQFTIGNPTPRTQTYWITDKGLAIKPTRAGLKITDAEKTDSQSQESQIKEAKETPQTSIEESVGKGVRKAQIGFAVFIWIIFLLIAYKKWGQSNVWKAVIILIGVGNAFNTYKIFSQPAVQKGSLKP
jgi:hypothetical protein